MDGKEIGLTRTTQGRLTQTKHKYSNVFVKRRGAWTSPNQPLVTRRTNAREEALHTNTQGKALLTHTEDKISNGFVKWRGAWASPNDPLSQNTRTYKQDLHTRDKVSNAFVKREVHGQARALPC